MKPEPSVKERTMRKPSKSETQMALIAITGVATGVALSAAAFYAAFSVPSHRKKHLSKKTK